MIVHCSMKISPEVVLFLHDTDTCFRRTFQITTCPKCGKTLGLLTQYVKATKERKQIKFKTTEKAEKAYRKYKMEANYTSADIPKSDTTFGLRYGSYTENRKNGKIVGYTEKATDFYGKSETLKKVNF